MKLGKLALAPLLIAAAPSPDAGLLVALDAIRAAALSRNATAAATYFAPDIALISQSGKLYGQSDALADLGGGFTKWENEGVAIRRDGPRAIVTLINHRQRPTLDPASFRVLQVWQLSAKRWRLIAQSSTKIASK